MIARTLSLSLIIVLFCFSLLMQHLICKKFFKKSIDPLNKWIEGKLSLALFFPKIYFQKKYFWTGYLLYLLSMLLLFLSIILFLFIAKGGAH